MTWSLHSPRISRRILAVISALGVAVVVVLAGLAYYLDVHRYPSEDTPLVLQSWGITLVRKQPAQDFGAASPPFSNISLAWSKGYEYGTYGWERLSTLKQLNVSDFALPEDLENYSSLGITCWGWDDKPYGIFITDYDGDGLFDYGDAVSLVTAIYENGVLTHQGFYPNTVYMFALDASGAGHYDPWQFKYAIHHEMLYAWEYHWHIA